MYGFSLHAAVRSGADERQALEQLCRHMTRPVLADERMQCNAAGQVALKLKTLGSNANPNHPPSRPANAPSPLNVM